MIFNLNWPMKCFVLLLGADVSVPVRRLPGHGVREFGLEMRSEGSGEATRGSRIGRGVWRVPNDQHAART